MGKQLCTEYEVHKFCRVTFLIVHQIAFQHLYLDYHPRFHHSLTVFQHPYFNSTEQEPSNTEVLINTALLARIESLEAENHSLRSAEVEKSKNFCLEQIQNGGLFCFYTSFPSFEIAFLSFLDLLYMN